MDDTVDDLGGPIGDFNASEMAPRTVRDETTRPDRVGNTNSRGRVVTAWTRTSTNPWKLDSTTVEDGKPSAGRFIFSRLKSSVRIGTAGTTPSSSSAMQHINGRTTGITSNVDNTGMNERTSAIPVRIMATARSGARTSTVKDKTLQRTKPETRSSDFGCTR